MIRSFIIILASMICFSAGAQVEVDSADRAPLLLTTVFNRSDTIAGMTDDSGNMPKLDNPAFPLITRYMGNELFADNIRPTILRHSAL